MNIRSILVFLLAPITACPALLAGAANRAQTPSGAWHLLKDSDGKGVKAGATVEIVFENATFRVAAVRNGERVNDTGTFQVKGRSITLDFKGMEQGHQSGPLAIGPDTMVLPFRMLSNEPGWSMWMRPAALLSFLSKVPSKPAGAEALPVLLARVQKVAEAFGNVAERQAIDKRAKARAGSYRGGEAEALYAQGAIFLMKGYYREAWYALARAASQKPNNAVYLSNLAVALQEIGSISDARAILEWVTKNYPNLDPPFGNLGAACLALADLHCARAGFTRAQALAPENGLYDYGLGKVLDREGRQEQALAQYRYAWRKGYSGSGKEGSR